MEKLFNRVTEQLQNNWAVDKSDIRTLLMFAMLYWNKVNR